MSVPGCEFLENCPEGQMVVDSIAFLVLLPMILCGPGGKPLAWTFRAWRPGKAAALQCEPPLCPRSKGNGLESFPRWLGPALPLASTLRFGTSSDRSFDF